MTHDPLSPSEALRTPIGAALAAVSVFAFVYSLLFAAQLLLGIIAVILLSVGPYLSYRLFAVLDSIADGVQRIAAAREREADGDARFDRSPDPDRTETREYSSESATERER